MNTTQIFLLAWKVFYKVSILIAMLSAMLSYGYYSLIEKDRISAQEMLLWVILFVLAIDIENRKDKKDRKSKLKKKKKQKL